MKYMNVKMIGDNETKRFLLEIPGANPLIVIGANPSTANEMVADRTINMAMNFAEREGFDGLIFMNLYPQRTTDPQKLDLVRNEELHNTNLEIFKEMLERVINPSVLLSYGDIVTTRGYLSDNLREILALFPSSTKWFKMKELTKKGNPRHLSRLSYIDSMSDAREYILNIFGSK